MQESFKIKNTKLLLIHHNPVRKLKFYQANTNIPYFLAISHTSQTVKGTEVITIPSILVMKAASTTFPIRQIYAE
jgi:hypothetical protein